MLVPSQLYLNKPDSLEQLAADLDRLANDPEMVACTYLNSVGNNCQECKKKNGFDSFNCNKVAWKDILSRIRKLMGEDE